MISLIHTLFLVFNEKYYGGKQREKFNPGGYGLYANSKIVQWDSQICNFYCVCDVCEHNIISD